MEQQKLEKDLLHLTAIFVGLFTLILSFNLLSFKPEAKVAPENSRQPAALNPRLNAVQVEASTQKLGLPSGTLPCLKDGLVHNFESPSPRLSLNLELCNADRETGKSFIVNKTNGFVATVFQLNTKKITTDLIDLAEGENHIHFSHQLSDGKKLMGEFVVQFKE